MDDYIKIAVTAAFIYLALWSFYLHVRQNRIMRRMDLQRDCIGQIALYLEENSIDKGVK